MSKSATSKNASKTEKGKNAGNRTRTLPANANAAQEKFKALLESTIDAKFARVMVAKTDGKKHLTYTDGITLTTSVRNIFRNKLETVPPQIEAACKLSEAVLAPSTAERINLIKAAVGIGGGVSGIAMVIGALGAALGWGAGWIASAVAFFVGGHVLVPALWAGTGIAIAAIAGYYAVTSNAETDTERFMTVLKRTTGEAVSSIWQEQGKRLRAS